MTQDFKQLRVWQEAYTLSLGVYKASKNFPAEERYGLTSQLRRAAVSVPANIAESCGKSTPAHQVQTLYVASGEVKELECLLLLARDLGYLPRTDFEPLNARLTSTAKMLGAFIRRIQFPSGDDG